VLVKILKMLKTKHKNTYYIISAVFSDLAPLGYNYLSALSLTIKKLKKYKCLQEHNNKYNILIIFINHILYNTY